MIIVVAVLAIIVTDGCVANDPTAGSLYQRLQAEDPAVRIQAAREAAQRKDRRAVGLLIDRLSDPEDDVRFFSHIALQKITDQDFGWQPWQPEAERSKAVQQWRAWWLVEQGASPEAATATGAADQLTPGDIADEPSPDVDDGDAPSGESATDSDAVTPKLADDGETDETGDAAAE
jgi:hypothetical protein